MGEGRGRGACGGLAGGGEARRPRGAGLAGQGAVPRPRGGGGGRPGGGEGRAARVVGRRRQSGAGDRSGGQGRRGLGRSGGFESVQLERRGGASGRIGVHRREWRWECRAGRCAEVMEKVWEGGAGWSRGSRTAWRRGLGVSPARSGAAPVASTAGCRARSSGAGSLRSARAVGAGVGCGSAGSVSAPPACARFPGSDRKAAAARGSWERGVSRCAEGSRRLCAYAKGNGPRDGVWEPGVFRYCFGCRTFLWCLGAKREGPCSWRTCPWRVQASSGRRPSGCLAGRRVRGWAGAGWAGLGWCVCGCSACPSSKDVS